MLLEELIEKEKYYKSECKNKDEEHEKKVEKGKATAAGMRQKAMESMSHVTIQEYIQYNCMKLK